MGSGSSKKTKKEEKSVLQEKASTVSGNPLFYHLQDCVN